MEEIRRGVGKLPVASAEGVRLALERYCHLVVSGIEQRYAYARM